MHARIVRFTDVDPGQIDSMLERIESEGPPEEVPLKGVQVFHDRDQGTAVVVQQYESADDLSVGEQVFAAMDAADTPGSRATVDRGELRLER